MVAARSSRGKRGCHVSWPFSSPNLGPCNGDPSDCICRAAELTLECLEESRGDVTPIAVAGALVCVAEASGELRIANMSRSLRRFLDHALYVSDLLPASFRDAHALMVQRVAEHGSRPNSVTHPLRVKLGTKSGRIQSAVLRLEQLPAEHTWIVVIVFCDDHGSGFLDVHEKTEEITVSHFGGSRRLSREYIRGDTPGYLSFPRLSVLFLDIQGFTNFVVSNDNEYVAAKLSVFHSTVATLVRVNNLWCIETRGDCYILVSGSNMVHSDVASTQVTRMLGFAKDLVEPQKDMGLDVRIGIATGPAETFFIFASSTNVPILCTTGPTMVTAARLETSGVPRYAHMCSNTVEKLRDEDFDFKGITPTFQQGAHKGLPPDLSSAMWDCGRGVFD